MRKRKDVREELAAGRAVRPRPTAIAAGIAPSTLYELIEKGEVRAIRIGRSLSIPPEEGCRLLGLQPGAA